MLPDNGAGSGYKYNQLQSLQNLTIKSNSEVIVQAFDQESGLLKRFEIAHGKIDFLKPVKSAGTARDLQNLVSMAPREGHLALINEAHGNGDLGFMGDADNLSVSHFRQAIKDGLAATGRTTLDVLGLDSCLMANVQALKQMAPLAKNVIASELEEFSNVAFGTPPTTTFDMQPVEQYLSRMLRYPPQKSEQAAFDMLKTSARRCNSQVLKNGICGTPTLAIYSPGYAVAAERALDQFGTRLTTAMGAPTVKTSIDSLIGKLQDVSEGVDQLRDVDDFATGIIKLTEEGTIKDKDGKLKLAARHVLRADRDLTQLMYVNKSATIVKYIGDAYRLHGVNTFLPGSDFDVREEAENIVGSSKAASLPLNELLNIEIRNSIPDDYSGGWANFLTSLRSS
jgi:hypothetical protein